MGQHTNIGFESFPEQGALLNKTVSVCFHYDTNRWLEGKVVRDDIDAPFNTIIELVDGRYVLSSECHFRLI